MIENINNLVENIKNNFVYDEIKGPKVVLHPGGHSEKSINNNSKINQYRHLLKNINKIKSKNYNLLLENMPPYPWYYGGKFYQHIFSDTKEIKNFAAKPKLIFVMTLPTLSLHQMFSIETLKGLQKTFLIILNIYIFPMPLKYIRKVFKLVKEKLILKCYSNYLKI